MGAVVVHGGKPQSAFTVAAGVGFVVGVQIQMVLEHCGKTETLIASVAIVFEVFSQDVQVKLFVNGFIAHVNLTDFDAGVACTTEVDISFFPRRLDSEKK